MPIIKALMGEPWTLRKEEIVNLTVREVVAFYSDRKKSGKQTSYKEKFLHVARWRHRELPPEEREAITWSDWRDYCSKNGLWE